tara:strand:+ start:2536 stop:3555 length:1020 start_codon:yes stop_codon:yes gene_type:complete
MSNHQVRLGTINQISLKELVCGGEQSHFTPWLSQNMEILEEVLGISVECLDTELYAGDGKRRADMLVELNGRDLAIIENQYGKADESHGWRTLHYALSLGAKAAFWIFEDISSDDERLISFLNDHPEINIIGIQARVYKIDDSLPAVDFQVIPASKQSLERVVMQARSARSVSDKEVFYGNYFPELIGEVQRKSNMKGAHSASKGHWNYYCSWNSALGCRNPWEAAFNQRRGGQGYYYIHLMLRDSEANKNFNWLRKNQEALTRGLPKDITVDFNFDPGRKSQKIRFIHPLSDISVEDLNAQDRQSLIDWTATVLPMLQKNLYDLSGARTHELLSVVGS